MRIQRTMIKQIHKLVSADCIAVIGLAVPIKQKYTKADVNHLAIESLFHRWECGILIGQHGLCSYVLALKAGFRRNAVSKFVYDNARQWCKAVGIKSKLNWK
jgi:hypothetical protein